MKTSSSAKTIESLLTSLSYEWNHHGSLDQLVKGVTADSREVKEGDLFVAIQGPVLDGHEFIEDAIRRGAVAIVTNRQKEKALQLTHVMVEDTQKAFAQMLLRFHGLDLSQIQLIGITGTNGKTTIAHLLYFLLNRLSSAGMIGTIDCQWKNKTLKTPNTTPGPAFLFPVLSQMIKDGIQYGIMEVSSHALDQKRTSQLYFFVRVFTNLTQDHLDYHPTIDDYFLAKKSLFTQLPMPQCAVINQDDPYGRQLVKALDPSIILTYGKDSKAQFSASHIVSTLDSTRFILQFQGETCPVEVPLVLEHNVSNVLAALAVMEAIGFSIKQATEHLKSFPGVSGRMEAVPSGKDFHVFVDYAHTPDAFQHVLSGIRPLIKNRLIVVFGCGGNRDKGKRPRMGRIASQYADLLILTNDNPRFENPAEILTQIQEDLVPGFRTKHEVVPDRRTAIQKAINEAKAGDAVLILGKGHEAEQIVGSTKLAFSDQLVARECIQARGC
ncbi:MAG: UDP-N-acetylmuramoyl-L-alanyl-D-glutamate--2,6-diaminopimelate ligase [Candidatus Omnitrophica bacterium CG11_big_fil_rev_8_21_14_0_20_45_26]|uniref:UDP-N-acetylmuramoyl-L-alanyl-D-glutamate--2,6-diaminopimelate ligase n=1 Tax=Candidatus Abzuiibacterium crystallinum TaxID=1974748 RepID=A0A2H0LPC4_9BACT|nr:MAG: UDP-N-acetylmuramoyl-L-alanyl-D-glutamate--2,6-diaminopimelate ligase [Candidatus Omnitrophica bacterium CG11_big_fil_rev_8_21_14_0_20_45_26]PIW64304.1 MAG: UDP-N-acetylmuramoyl-L-alanyl-D-glutamate--2,6-diaminopimelate ligase [Candidatus Omnitrophica bacterium CG12_big_fil_rev_8_21_14_0_65_45_16]